MSKILLVVDGHNMMYRGYYAITASNKGKSLTGPEGNPTDGIKGLATILAAELRKTEATHCAVVFDHPSTGFRHEIYPEYKGTRSHDGINLEDQIPMARKLLKAIGIRSFYVPGYEGDDVTGTLARSMCRHVDMTIINSRDKDFAQLVDDKRNICMLFPKETEYSDAAAIEEKFGVPPKKIIEYLMMLGDTVDNIPGVYKCGPKTAAKLLSAHGSLRRIVKASSTFTPALKRNFAEAASQFDLTRKLITIDTKVALGINIDDLRRRNVDREKLRHICDKLGFVTTYKQLSTL